MQLSAEDDIDTFKVLRDFLYCNKITLIGVGVDKITKILQAAHRWAVMELFFVIIEFVLERNAVGNSRDLLSLLPVVTLPDVPDRFKSFFWTETALCFDGFSPGENAIDIIAKSDKAVADNSKEALVDNSCAPAKFKPFGQLVKVVQKFLQEKQACPSNDSDVPSAENIFTEVLCPLVRTMWQLALSEAVIYQLVSDVVCHTERSELVTEGISFCVLHASARVLSCRG